MIRRLVAVGLVAATVAGLGAATAGASPTELRVKEGACVRIEGAAPDLCVSNPFPGVHDALDGLPLP